MLYTICKFYYILYEILHIIMVKCLLIIILIKDKKLLHFEISKLGQILCGDKTPWFSQAQSRIVNKLCIYT